MAAALTLACEDTSRPTQPEVTDFWGLQIASGDGQVGAAGAQLPAPLTVRVVNGANRPVEGASIQWSVPAGGTLNETITRTDVNGRASTRLALGTYAGSQVAAATIAGQPRSRVSFTAVALIQGATRITFSPTAHGNHQRDTVLARLAPYRVLARDHNDTPVPGVVVDWFLFGRGSISSRTSITDANGIAQVTHTLGTIVGLESVQASVSGLIGSPLTFAPFVDAGAPVSTQMEGNDQVGRVGTELTYRLRVNDTWGNEVPQVALDWVVTSGAGSIVPGAYGYARHTLGANEGLQTVTATVRNSAAIAPAPFRARAVTETISVGINYYCYSSPVFFPSEVTVPSGRTVGWLWDTSCIDLHDITFEDDPKPPVSTSLTSRGTHVRTFTGAPRTIRYRCTRHSTSFESGMVGRVIIQ